MKLLFWKCFFVLVVCLAFTAIWASTPTVWQPLAPGLEYTKLSGFAGFPGGAVHAFRIDLQYFRFKLMQVPQNGNSPADDFQQLLSAHHAVLATNGGFFTPEFKPLGLRITDKNELSPTRNISWWGVFFVKENRAYLVPQQDYRPDTQIDFAIQAGPRLLVHSERVSGLNTKIDTRTALGITANDKVVLLTTEDLLISTIDLADLLKRPQEEGGLGCVEAINLDGGHSAQMYTLLPNFSLAVSNNARVADAILVIPVGE